MKINIRHISGAYSKNIKENNFTFMKIILRNTNIKIENVTCETDL